MPRQDTILCPHIYATVCMYIWGRMTDEFYYYQRFAKVLSLQISLIII